MSNALEKWSKQYVAQKAIFSFMGSSFYLYNADGSLAFYIKQKAFRLKEEISVFTDEGQTDKALGIQARGILDTSATYDVTDAKSGEKVGALRRQGLKSILRDEWTLLGPGDAEIGKIMEDSMGMALLRRFLGNGLVPQHFVITLGDKKVGGIDGRFNPFRLMCDVKFEGDLDPRLGVAATVLILAIEGRQQ